MSRPKLTLNRRTLVQLTAGLIAARNLSLPRFAAAQPAFPGNGDPPYLVDAAWVQQRLAVPDANLRILDCSPLRTYQDEHIPGAVHAWWQDTMDQNKSVYGGVMRPNGRQPDGTFAQTSRKQALVDLGIDDQTFVVSYDDEQGRWAAHMVWFLRFLGHTNAAMLDGGVNAWREAGFDTESGENEPPDLDEPTVTPQDGFYVETSDFKRLLESPTTQLVDVRTDSELQDDVNGTLALGRIPGSTSFPWNSVLADDYGRLRSPDEIIRLLAAAGITSDQPVVLYARFGVEASHTWLVLKLLNYPTVTIYDGGWAGWVADSSNPVEPL